MNWIDFNLALLVFGLYEGFIDGLIIEIAELAALVWDMGCYTLLLWNR